MNFLTGLDFNWIIGGAVALLALVGGFFKVRSDAKKEGVQQERSKQVEAARKETTTAVQIKNRAQAAPKSEIQEKFSKYTRKK